MAEPNKVVEFPDARTSQQESINVPLNVTSLESALATIEPETRDAMNEWLIRRCAPTFRLGAEEFELRRTRKAEPNRRAQRLQAIHWRRAAAHHRHPE